MSYLRKYKRWTEADDVALVKLIKAKKTGIEHWCEVFESTRQGVNHRIKYLRDAGLLEKPEDVKFWTKEKDAKLIEMRNAGTSYKECGEAFGTTEGAAQIRFSRLRNGRKASGQAVAAGNGRHSKPAPEPIKPPAEAVTIAPVHYLNVRAGQCRHFVNGGLMCGHVAKRNDRCEQHA